MVGYLILALLIGASFGELYGQRDKNLDPGIIKWPKATWVPSPIQMYEENSKYKVQFNFRPESRISNGILEVQFPSSLSASKATCAENCEGEVIRSNSVILKGVSLSEELDTSVSLFLEERPDPGPYGPFGILTRNYEEGPIVDVNKVFGKLAVGPEPILGSDFNVTEPEGVSSFKVGKRETMLFKFTTETFLEPNDVVEIQLSEYFEPNAVECEAVELEDNLLPVGPEDSKSIPCLGVEGNIWIYGISNFIPADTTLELKVKGIVPLLGLDNSLYSWTLNTYRWGTWNKLQTNTIKDFPVVNTIAYQINEGASFNTVGYPKDKIFNGLAVFTEVSVRIEHEVPAGGMAELEFRQGAQLDTATWYLDSEGNPVKGTCYALPSDKKPSCQIDPRGNIARAVFEEKLDPGTKVSIYTLTEFVVKNNIETIFRTMNAEGYWIDETGGDVVSVPYKPEGFELMKDFRVFSGFSDNLSEEGFVGGKKSDRKLLFATEPKNSWSSDTSLEIHCPFTSEGVSLERIYISEESEWSQESGSLDKVLSLDSGTSSAEVTFSGKAVSLQPGEVDSGDYFGLSVTKDIAMPLAATNKATFYQCWAMAQTGSSTEIGTLRFTVVPQEPSGWSVTTLCSDNDAPGIPLYLEAAGKQMDFGKDYYYFIEVSIPGSLDSGLEVGDTYPVDGSLKASAQLKANEETTKIQIKLEEVLEKGSSYFWFVPKGNLGSSKDITTLFYYLKTDKNMPFVVFEKTSEDVAESTSTEGSFSVDLLEPSSFETNLVTETEIQVSGGSSSKGFVGLILPQGFHIKSSASISDGSSSPSEIYTLTVNNGTFAYPSIIFKESSSFNLQDSQKTLTISGVTPPDGVGSESQTVNFYMFEASTPGDSCATQPTLFTADLKPQELQILSLSPKTVERKGPNSVNTAVEVVFKTNTKVPKGGYIQAILSPDWTQTDFTACEVNGADLDCTLNGRTANVTVTEAVEDGKELTISFKHLHTKKSGSSAAYIESIQTLDSKGNIINSNTDIDQEAQLTSAGDPGDTNFEEVAVFPNYSSAPRVDLYLRTSFGITLPVFSVIEITSENWTEDFKDNAKNLCFASEPLYSCEVKQGLEVTLKKEVLPGKIIEIFLGSSFNLPSGTSNLGIQVRALWQGEVVASASSAPEASIDSKPPSFADSSLRIRASNAGVSTDYYFKFKSSVGVSKDDEIWLSFPSEYDFYLGASDNFLTTCDPDSFYIDCRSDAFPNARCKVDHRMVVVQKLNDLPEDSEVDIDIKEIYNPAQGTITEVRGFILDKNMKIKSQGGFGTQSITSVPEILRISDVSVENNKLGEKTKYTFKFILEGDINEGEELQVRFPEQYERQISKNKEIECSVFYFEGGSKKQVSKKSSCKVNGKWILAELEETQIDKETFYMTIENLGNPDWGIERSSDPWAFEDQDTLTFGENDFWTGKFKLFRYSPSRDEYVSSSYDNLNAAYIGLDQTGDLLSSINAVTGTIGRRRQVFAGTRTDKILINTGEWPLYSKKLSVVPQIEESGISFYSPLHNYTIYKWGKEMWFEVGVDKDTSAGVYFIEWSVDELPDDRREKSFNAPYKIILEVCEFTEEVLDIEIADIPTIFYGNSSIPVAVEAEKAPNSELTLKVSFEEAEGLEAVPSEVTFKPGEKVKYFQVSVPKDYSGPENPKVSFELTGKVSALYKTPESRLLYITQPQEEIRPADLDVLVEDLQKTSVSLSFESNDNGVLYWWLACQGNPLPSFEELKDSVSSFVEEDNNLSLSEQLSQQYKNSEYEMDNDKDDSVYDFLRRLQTKHCKESWRSAFVMYSDQSEAVTVDWLMTETSYSWVGYMDNLRFYEDPVPVQLNFTTLEKPLVYKVSVIFEADRLNFDATITDDLAVVLAKHMNIPTAWVVEKEFEIPAKKEEAEFKERSLKQSAVFSYYLLYGRWEGNIVPEKFTEQASQNSAALKQELSELTEVEPKNIEINFDKQEYESTPEFIEEPDPFDIRRDEINFEIEVSSPGLVVTVCTQKDQTPLAEQIYLGVNSEYKEASSARTPIRSINEVTIEDLEKETDYYCYFTACDNYPLWPNCNSEITELEVSTNEKESDSDKKEKEEDFAASLVAGLFIFCIF